MKTPPGKAIHIYLPTHIVEWLDKQKESRSSIIRSALVKYIVDWDKVKGRK